MYDGHEVVPDEEGVEFASWTPCKTKPPPLSPIWHEMKFKPPEEVLVI
jgi:hypothetical protein